TLYVLDSLLILSADEFDLLKDFKKALAVLDEQQNLLNEKWDEIFGEEGKKWLKFSLLYAYAEIYFERGSKAKSDHLEKLLSFTKKNESSIQYGAMYANIETLLKKMGKEKQIDQLVRPRTP
ncbi:MAG: hypothetical protein AAFO69_01625, partial [Bacteroidota bacterium]